MNGLCCRRALGLAARADADAGAGGQPAGAGGVGRHLRPRHRHAVRRRRRGDVGHPGHEDRPAGRHDDPAARTAFNDTEGITYAGGGQVRVHRGAPAPARAVHVRRRGHADARRRSDGQARHDDRQHRAGGRLVRPQTGGFIVIKETQPLGIFQTGIDFAAGTATNGSPTTENSVNLFDPALAGLSDFSDVYALSNLPGAVSGADAGHLLIISQESGRIVEVDRAGRSERADDRRPTRATRCRSPTSSTRA